MSTIVYKNLLIVERASPHNLFLKSMNIDFDDENKPFKYINPTDKVIFYFENSLKDNDEIATLPGDYDLNNFQKNIWKGLIKIYSDGTQIKIHHLRFEDINTFKLCLIVFNQYLIHCIYNLVPEKDINDTKFALHWDNNILTEEYKNIAKHLKIYSEDIKNNNKHVFSVDNIKEFANNTEILKNTNPQPTFIFNNSLTNTSQPVYVPSSTTNTPIFTAPTYNNPTPITNTPIFTAPTYSNSPSTTKSTLMFTAPTYGNPTSATNTPIFAASTYGNSSSTNSTMFASPTTNTAPTTTNTSTSMFTAPTYNNPPTTTQSNNLFGFKTNTGFKSSFGGFPSHNTDKK